METLNENEFNFAKDMWKASELALNIDNQQALENTYNSVDIIKKGIKDINACFVASNDDEIIVSFRGTLGIDEGEKLLPLEEIEQIINDNFAQTKALKTINDIKAILNVIDPSIVEKIDEFAKKLNHAGVVDWLQNFNMLPMNLPLFEGKTHLGFVLRFYTLMNELKDKVNEKISGNKKLYITGHSKGAALATLGAYFFTTQKDLPSPTKVITFATPRVGDMDFKKAYEAQNINHIRYDSIYDLIPHLPFSNNEREVLDRANPIYTLFPKLNYASVGELKSFYIKRDELRSFCFTDNSKEFIDKNLGYSPMVEIEKIVRSYPSLINTIHNGDYQNMFN